MIRSVGVKNLSKTTIKKIERMIAAVLAEPEFYDQDTFGDQLCKNDGNPTCGTVCCAAGWAVWLDNRPLYNKYMKKQLDDRTFTFPAWEDAALKALGLEADDESKNRLFGYASNWPAPFDDQYRDATTPKGRANAFARRWRKFIQSDGLV